MVHRTQPFNLAFPPPQILLRTAVTSARFCQFVTAAVQSLEIPLVLESEDTALTLDSTTCWLFGLNQVTQPLKSSNVICKVSLIICVL